MARKTGRIRSKGRLIAAAVTLVVAPIAAVTVLSNTSIDTATGASETPTAAAPIAPPALVEPVPVVEAEPTCPAGQTYIGPEHVGVDGMQICLPVGSELAESHVDPLYGEIALEILREMAPFDGRLEIREPKVVCWSLEDWKRILELFRADDVQFASDLAGWVPRANRVINLSYMTCERLDKFAHAGTTPQSRLAASPVWTLTHETVHLGGIPHEGTADCYARQFTSTTASLLGADSTIARQIAELSAEQAEKARAGTHYEDPECRDGGSLDLDVDDVVWS